jgi:RNA 3'-terminal phosphate cyclase-like protein
LKSALFPNLKHFGIEGIDLKIIKRGLAPNGGGEVLFTCSTLKQLETVSLIEEGKIKRIRGIAFSCKVSPDLVNRMIDSMRGVFNDYIPDVWIHSDHFKGSSAGK